MRIHLDGNWFGYCVVISWNEREMSSFLANQRNVFAVEWTIFIMLSKLEAIFELSVFCWKFVVAIDGPCNSIGSVFQRIFGKDISKVVLLTAVSVAADSCHQITSSCFHAFTNKYARFYKHVWYLQTALVYNGNSQIMLTKKTHISS